MPSAGERGEKNLIRPPVVAYTARRHNTTATAPIGTRYWIGK